MSDASEKPFAATPQRVAKAKREGNVARSSELGANVAFAAAIASTVAVAPLLGGAARAAIARAAAGGLPLATCVAIVACGTLPIAAASLAGCLAAIAQNGGLRFVATGAKLHRLDPLGGLRRMLSRETAGHTVRAALAFAVATGVMLPAIASALAEALRAQSLDAAAAAAWYAARRVAFGACATGVLFAFFEFAAARKAWLEKLRMTFDERKRELKEQEGDPSTRSRRRAMARSLLRGSLRKVKDAAFVVANPTHVAVALEYRPPDIPVPRIVVRAAETAALRVRAIADARNIPVVENAALARALFREGRIGDPIPHLLYVAVAEVVAALMRGREWRR